MAARIRRIEHTEEVRQRIRTSQLVRRLTNHAFGRGKPMDSTQVTAALGVLKKSLPDLSAMVLTGSMTTKTAVETPEEVLERIVAEGSGAGVAIEAEGAQEPSPVH